jgi:hypothetical protein
MGEGQYCHFGLKSCLVRLVELNSSVDVNLTLQVNMDGLPLFNNSTTSVWPILVSILGSANKVPEVVGIYVGSSKPKCIISYLDQFVQEFSEVEKSGIRSKSKEYKINSQDCKFICDAPPRAFVKGVKGHSGYFGCDKCKTKGLYSLDHRKITFPEI